MTDSSSEGVFAAGCALNTVDGGRAFRRRTDGAALGAFPLESGGAAAAGREAVAPAVGVEARATGLAPSVGEAVCAEALATVLRTVEGTAALARSGAGASLSLPDADGGTAGGPGAFAR
jgi:hypothetical protein